MYWLDQPRGKELCMLQGKQNVCWNDCPLLVLFILRLGLLSYDAYIQQAWNMNKRKSAFLYIFSFFYISDYFIKMNLLWYRFCLFFSFRSETLHSSLCSSFWNLSTKYQKINKTKQTTQYSVILSFGGEHFELCGFFFFMCSFNLGFTSVYRINVNLLFSVCILFIITSDPIQRPHYVYP